MSEMEPDDSDELDRAVHFLAFYLEIKHKLRCLGGVPVDGSGVGRT